MKKIIYKACIIGPDTRCSSVDYTGLYQDIDLQQYVKKNSDDLFVSVGLFLEDNLTQITKNVNRAGFFFESEEDALEGENYHVNMPMVIVALEIDTEKSPQPTPLYLRPKNKDITKLAFRNALDGTIISIKPFGRENYATAHGVVLRNSECIYPYDNPEYKKIILPNYSFYDATLGRVFADDGGLFYSVRAAVLVLNDLKRSSGDSSFFKMQLTPQIEMLEKAITKQNITDIEQAVRMSENPHSYNQDTNSFSNYQSYYNELSMKYSNKMAYNTSYKKSARK